MSAQQVTKSENILRAYTEARELDRAAKENGFSRVGNYVGFTAAA